MPRQAMPTPFVSRDELTTGREVVPLLGTLREIWPQFLEAFAVRVANGERSESRLRQLKRAEVVSRSLPDFPTSRDLHQWVGNMKCGPGTRENFSDSLSSLYAWAVAKRRTTHQPFVDFDYTAPEPKRRAIRQIEARWPQLLACAANERERAFLAVLRYTGLRISEVLALEARHFESRGSYWTVKVEQQRSEHKAPTADFIVPRLKTPRAYRTVALHPECRALVAQVLALPPATTWLGRGAQTEVATPLVFPFRSNNLAVLAKSLRAVAPDDFPGDNLWHVFRHTIASELKTRGTDVVEISRFLGHAGIKHTQDYLRSLDGDDAAPNLFAGWDTASPRQPAQDTLRLGPLNAVQPTGGAPPTRQRQSRAVEEKSGSERLVRAAHSRITEAPQSNPMKVKQRSQR